MPIRSPAERRPCRGRYRAAQAARPIYAWLFATRRTPSRPAPVYRRERRFGSIGLALESALVLQAEPLGEKEALYARLRGLRMCMLKDPAATSLPIENPHQ